MIDFFRSHPDAFCAALFFILILLGCAAWLIWEFIDDGERTFL